jgi:hypothetical protein
LGVGVKRRSCAHICIGAIGIAFATPGYGKPRVVQQWPCNKKVANKVPTKLLYKAGRKKPLAWGFGCQDDETDFDHGARGTMVAEMFKLFLDDDVLEEHLRAIEGDDSSKDDVAMYFEDFLIAIRHHVMQQVGKELEIIHTKDWNAKRIDYTFSMPTMWCGTNTVEKFERIIAAAGFKSENHTATVTLSEAEAAVASTIDAEDLQIYPTTYPGPERLSLAEAGVCEGSTLLVVDAGGGTTVGLHPWSNKFGCDLTWPGHLHP